MCCLTNLLFFDIPLFSGDIYVSSGISNSFSFCECKFFECKFLEGFEGLVILSAILVPIKSPTASAVF